MPGSLPLTAIDHPSAEISIHFICPYYIPTFLYYGLLPVPNTSHSFRKLCSVPANNILPEGEKDIVYTASFLDSVS